MIVLDVYIPFEMMLHTSLKAQNGHKRIKISSCYVNFELLDFCATSFYPGDLRRSDTKRLF